VKPTTNNVINIKTFLILSITYFHHFVKYFLSYLSIFSCLNLSNESFRNALPCVSELFPFSHTLLFLGGNRYRDYGGHTLEAKRLHRVPQTPLPQPHHKLA